MSAVDDKYIWSSKSYINDRKNFLCVDGEKWNEKWSEDSVKSSGEGEGS